MDHECYGYVDFLNIENNEFIKCAVCGKELGA
jgi:hypothetical protein